MAQWLYRYVFRGIGILFVVGMITLLFLAIRSHNQAGTAGAPAGQTEGGRK